jgi:hypothetical protein
VYVGAVGEAAELGRLVELGEVIAQRVAVEVPQAELADAGGVDEISSVAEVVECRRRGRVAAGAALVQGVRGELQARVERVEDRRLADAAVADERRQLPQHLLA